jgi:flagellar L-ring protein precursor FlgH
MRILLLAATLVLCAAPLVAQNDAPADATPLAAAPAPRASWLSDRRGFTVGDLLTIIVDEQTLATERNNHNATANRGQSTGLNIASGTSPATTMGFTTGLNESSTNTGTTDREGRLSATVTVRVTEIEPNGVLVILGTREVTVDGRKQLMTLRGVIRPEDVSPQNVVQSSRVANAAIAYSGNGLGPRRGILGSIVHIFWP